MNPTMFDPIALEHWYSGDENSLLLQTELEKYFQNYLPCSRSDHKGNCSEHLYRGC